MFVCPRKMQNNKTYLNQNNQFCKKIPNFHQIYYHLTNMMYFYASVFICNFSSMGIFNMENLCWEKICILTLNLCTIGSWFCILYSIPTEKKSLNFPTTTQTWFNEHQKQMTMEFQNNRGFGIMIFRFHLFSSPFFY